MFFYLFQELPTFKKPDDLRKPKNPALKASYLNNERPLENQNQDPSNGESDFIVMEFAEDGVLKEKVR